MMDQRFHEYAEVLTPEEALEMEEEGWTRIQVKSVKGKMVYFMGRNKGMFSIRPSQVHPLHKGHTWIGLVMLAVGGFFLLFSQGSGFGILQYTLVDQVLIGLGLILFFAGVFEVRGEK